MEPQQHLSRRAAMNKYECRRRTGLSRITRYKKLSMDFQAILAFKGHLLWFDELRRRKIFRQHARSDHLPAFVGDVVRHGGCRTAGSKTHDGLTIGEHDRV